MLKSLLFVRPKYKKQFIFAAKGLLSLAARNHVISVIACNFLQENVGKSQEFAAITWALFKNTGPIFFIRATIGGLLYV